MDLNTEQSPPELTIFYDGFCPLCIKEMQHLRKLNTNNQLALVNIQNPEELEPYPELDTKRAMNILQGRLQNGDYIEGLDVTHKAWSLLGKGHFTFFLRLPVLRLAFDIAYKVFAKHRYSFSFWLTGKRYGCDACSNKKPQ